MLSDFDDGGIPLPPSVARSVFGSKSSEPRSEQKEPDRSGKRKERKGKQPKSDIQLAYDTQQALLQSLLPADSRFGENGGFTFPGYTYKLTIQAKPFGFE